MTLAASDSNPGQAADLGPIPPLAAEAANAAEKLLAAALGLRV